MLERALWEERFRQYLEVRGFSPRTFEGYRSSLKTFFEFLQDEGIGSLSGVTRDHLEAYRTRIFYQRSRRSGDYLTLGSQHARITALKAFFKFLVRRGFLLVDVAAGIDLPRKEKSLPTVLTESEVLRLLESCDPSTLYGVRNRTMLEVLYGTGVRNSELCNLQVDACDLAVPALRILHGKGGKSRVVPLGEEALAWLEAYFGQVRPHLVSLEDPGQVFLTRSGQAFNRDVLTGLMRRLTARAGLGKKATAHSLRHSMATHMLRRGAGLRHLQVLLGHASSETTEHYTRVELSDLRRVLLRCHPRERAHRQ